MSYRPRRAPRTTFLDIRGLRCHVRTWGDAAAPPLLLLHGWMDIAASWQFVVDELGEGRHVIAPDWRGFGRSQWDPNGYWFPDYYADLDALLEYFAPDAAADLVGHSMGGNVASIYAGVRPARVRRLVSLEGFGLPGTSPEAAPARIGQWLDAWRKPPSFRPYASLDALAARLAESSPGLAAGQALYLAREHAMQEPDGSVAFSSDPRHKAPNAIPYRLDEAKACWRNVAAPVLWLLGAESKLLAQFYGEGLVELDARAACFANLERITLQGCGHMLHHDAPKSVAAALEKFLAP